MLKTNKLWRKLLPLPLTLTPLIALSCSNSQQQENEHDDFSGQTIDQIVKNPNISLQDKLTTLKNKLTTLKDLTKQAQHLKTTLDNLETLNQYVNKINDMPFKTTEKDTLPMFFSKELGIKKGYGELKKEGLGLQNEYDYLRNISLESRDVEIISINNNAGEITIEITLNYQGIATTITKIITGFKKFSQEIDDVYYQFIGFFEAIKKNGVFDVSDKISTQNTVGDLLAELTSYFPDTKGLIELSAKKNKTELSGEKMLKYLVKKGEKNDVVNLNIDVTNWQNNALWKCGLIYFKLTKDFSEILAAIPEILENKAIDLKNEITLENTWQDTFPYINDYLITQLNKQFMQDDVKSVINNISWGTRYKSIDTKLKDDDITSSVDFKGLYFKFDHHTSPHIKVEFINIKIKEDFSKILAAIPEILENKAIDLKNEITRENTWLDTFPYINDYLITQLNKQFKQDDVKSVIAKISWDTPFQYIFTKLKDSSITDNEGSKLFYFKFDDYTSPDIRIYFKNIKI